MTTMSNGQVRKSLASQIDRLDALLDGLADGLNELVVTAVKQAVEVAVKEAVRSVLSEVLTNPDLVSKLQGAVRAPAGELTARCDKDSTSRLSLWHRLGQICSWIGHRLMYQCRSCGDKVRTLMLATRAGCAVVVERCNRLVQKAGHGAMLAWHRMQVVRSLKYQLLTALTVGALCGTGVFFAGPYVAAVTSGIGGFGTSCAVQMGIWLRRMLSMPVELAESLR